MKVLVEVLFTDYSDIYTAIRLLIRARYLGGWNFLVCEECESIKKCIAGAKCKQEKKRLDSKLQAHYDFQKNHRRHYAKVA